MAVTFFGVEEKITNSRKSLKKTLSHNGALIISYQG